MRTFFCGVFTMMVLISCHTSKTPTTNTNPAKNNSNYLNGSWQLQTLFASDSKWIKAPYLNIDLKEKTFTGSGSCNAVSGKFIINEGYLAFDKNILSTKMACTGTDYEKSFLSALLKINTYNVNKNELEFSQGEIVLMKFKRMN